MGTSRNTGSDKQTYYKMTQCGSEPDSVRKMAKTLFEGGCVDGDIAMAEAAGSLRAFYHLVDIGVPFPFNKSGEYVGYKTDHDPLKRGISAGPLTSKYMTECLERQAEERGIPFFDGYQAVRLLTEEKDGKKRAAGIIALNKQKAASPDERYAVFSACREEFYDFSKDPDALNNLIDEPDFQEQIQDFRRRLLTFLEESEDPVLPDFQRFLAEKGCERQ